MRSASAALLVAAALGAGAVDAQVVLYKWVDDQGKTQYSDRAPKGFKGEVTRIETEVEKSTLPPAATPATAPAPVTSPGAAPTKAAAPPSNDIAAKRRANRVRLEEQLTKARDKLAAAKGALEQAQSPEPEERQIVQQRTAGGGMHGMAPRSNCRVEGSGKNKTLMCPTFIPTPEYHDKVARLEEDVRKAEDELAEAERAWRRGVD
jgi:hypothetical protein